MTARRSLSPTKRLAVFERHRGVCHLCEQRIQVGQSWEVEHVRALALGGADDESNMRPAHEACHGIKTKADNASWTKAKRAKMRHLGIRRSSNPMPGSKASGLRKRMNGQVERRT